MKKFSMAALVLVLAFALTVPAMAETTIDFSGSYRVRGWSVSDISLDGRYDDSDDENTTVGLTNGLSDHEQFMASTFSQERMVKNGVGTAGTAESYDGRNGLIDGIKKHSTQSWFDNRFRMDITFNVNDNVSVFTRIDGIDSVFPNTAADTDDYGDDGMAITMEYAWMQFTTGIGMFKMGVMPSGGKIGNDAFNSNREVARLQYLMGVGNFGFAATYDKGVEIDSIGSTNQEDLNNAIGNEDYDSDENDGTAPDPFQDGDYMSDADIDTYMLTFTYINDMISSGFTLAYVRDARSSEDYNSTTAGLLNAMVNTWEGMTPQFVDSMSSGFVPRADAENGTGFIIDRDYWDYDFNGAYDQHVWGTNLFVNLTLGNARIMTEFNYAWGERDWDDPMLFDADIETWSIFLAAGYNFGMVDVELGWIYAPGQDHSDDLEEQLVTFFTATNEEESNEARNANGTDQEDDGDLVYDDLDDVIAKSGSTLTAWGTASGGIGSSFGPLFLMTGNGNIGFDLNTHDNLDVDNNSIRGEVSRAGASLVYLKTAVTPMENLTLNFAWGHAWTTADREDIYDPFDNFDEGSSYGWEVDAGFSWKIMDNVTYDFQFAYWDLGDAWDEINRETWADDGTNNGDTATDLTNLLVNDEGPAVLSAQFRGMQSYNHDAIDDVYVFQHGITVDF